MLQMVRCGLVRLIVRPILQYWSVPLRMLRYVMMENSLVTSNNIHDMPELKCQVKTYISMRIKTLRTLHKLFQYFYNSAQYEQEMPLRMRGRASPEINK